MGLQLVHHLIVNPDGSLPDCPDCLYAYILAGNGVFVSARRPGLEALIPVVSCRIAGLPDLDRLAGEGCLEPQCASIGARGGMDRDCDSDPDGLGLAWPHIDGSSLQERVRIIGRRRPELILGRRLGRPIHRHIPDKSWFFRLQRSTTPGTF